MTDTTTRLNDLQAASARVKESHDRALRMVEQAAEGKTDVSTTTTALSHLALLNGLIIQQAALDVAIENVRVQERIATAQESQALTLKTLLEEASGLASDLSIISGQNPGGYRWSPQVSVEVANWGDQR